MEKLLLRCVETASSGRVHAGLIAASLVLIFGSLYKATSSALRGNHGKVKILYRVPLAYDIVLQILLGVTLALFMVLKLHQGTCTPEPLLLGYIFCLQLINVLISRITLAPIRKVFRRHVRALIGFSTILSLVTDILPMLILSQHTPLNPLNLIKIGSLLSCIVAILFTPRSVVVQDDPSGKPYLGIHGTQETKHPTPAPEEYCSPFAYCISYGWLTRYIYLGCRRKLLMEDLPPLPQYDDPVLWLKKVQDARRRGITTLKTIALLMHRELATQALFAITTALVEFIAPFSMYNLLSFLQNSEDAMIHPSIWVALLFLGPVARSVSYQQYIFTSTRFIVRIKVAFVQEIYHKLLQTILFESSPDKKVTDPASGDLNTIKISQRSENEGEFGAGHIINLMSFDTDAIESARDVVLISTAVPIEVAIATTFLYALIGWSALVGLVVMLLSLSLPTIFSHRMVRVQQSVMSWSDKRIAMISEYLDSIRIIKYFGWEDAMAEKVRQTRRLEQLQIWKRNMYAIAVVWSGDFIPLFTLLVMFTSYTAVAGQPLQAATAFACLSITETLRQQFVWVSNVSGFASQAVVSIRRIDKFFRTAVPKTEIPAGLPSFTNASFVRSPGASFRLDAINFKFTPGCLNVVTGPTGSGKTTLLLSLLGETVLQNGSVSCPRDAAYVSQSAWLWSGTVRDNILFYSEYEVERYNATTKACGLCRDFDELPKGDLTDVGEQGATLSGGQRQRVALARAIYSRASTLLLDDIFSALDISTASLIFDEFFKKEYLRGRTVILVSHLPLVIQAAKFVVRLENGRVMSAKAQKPSLVSSNATETVTQLSGDGMYQLPVEEVPNPVPLMKDSAKTTLEKTLDGRIPRSLFFRYMLQFGGYPYALLALLSAFCTQIAFFSSTLWLAVWTGAYTKEGAINLGFYLGCYACILLTFNLMVPLNNTIFQYGAWRAARALHTRLINSVLNVPIKWFDSNPVGTVLNRFSSDMASLDSIIVGWLRMTLDNQIRLCLRIGAIASVLPIFALPAAVLCSIGFAVGEVYTRCQISIKRLTSASNSPIFAHFSETIAGLPTIRAQHGMGEVFGLVLAGHMANYARAYEALYNSNRWVSVRADMIAASVAACAGSIAVVKSQSISAGLVGFSLTNAIGLSQTILQMVRNMNELEVELNSFQRVMEYGSLKSEREEIEAAAAAADDSSFLSPTSTPANWPSSGKVVFQNFSANYYKDGPDVLKGITFEAVPGERIGIIGRTGSGKTSLGLSLLRFTNQSAGSISIDDIDIRTIGLTRLRQAITIIPQEPTLFAGDVRSNLDPFGELDDTELNNILRACGCLEDLSPSTPLNNKLDEFRLRRGESSTSSEANSRSQSPQSIRLSTPVTTRGANFSAGQRQIICMARAICRRSKVVLLDEATSSVDSHTDLRIQNVLRTEFRGSTIFTVAHRLDTIADYDRVLVLSAGEIVEVDSPRRLYEKKGVFWKMIQETGQADKLIGVMQ